VDPVAGSPSNSGSSASPWRTLQEVFDSGKTFAAGDVIYLRSGNHGTPVIRGGISTGSRTIKAEPGQTPRMKTLRFQSGATRWTVDGILVSPQEANGTFTTGNLVQIDSGATNNVLQNSSVRAANDSSAQTWTNEQWVQRSGTAILVAGSNNQVLGTKIRNVRNGIMLERTSTAGAGATGAIIRRNDVEHFWEDAYRCKVSGCLLENNTAINSYAVVPPGMEADPPHRDMFQSYRGDGSFTPVTDVVCAATPSSAAKAPVTRRSPSSTTASTRSRASAPSTAPTIAGPSRTTSSWSKSGSPWASTVWTTAGSSTTPSYPTPRAPTARSA
jgi:hypothetical protein